MKEADREAERDGETGRPSQDDRDRSPSSDRSDPVARLHRSVGNQAVQALYERGAIQAKLTVSSPDDESEREAERVAEQVVEADPEPAEEDERRRAQRRATAGPVVDADALQRSADVESGSLDDQREQQVRSIQGGGRPLPGETRSYFESRFGRDFGDVRVHTGDEADRAARSINAEAFTMGSDVAFARGNYEPNTESGKKLLAHELTHVVQQGGADRVQRQPPGGEAAGAATETRGPSDEAKSFTAFGTDVLSVLDVGASLAELTPALSQATAGMAGMASAFGLGVFALLSWASALNADKTWAAVQGASYAVVSIAKGRHPPGPHDQINKDAQGAWNQAAQRAKTQFENRIDAGGEQRRTALRTILGIREQDPGEALNRIYQHQVDQQMQSYVLGFIPAGGVSWKMAKNSYLFWPGPDMTTSV